MTALVLTKRQTDRLDRQRLQYMKVAMRGQGYATASEKASGVFRRIPDAKAWRFWRSGLTCKTKNG